MLKLKLQYFGHLMKKANSLENTLMLEMNKAKEEGGRGWLDSIMDSVDMSLSKLQETGEERGAWHATLHDIMKSRTQLSN